MPFIVPPWLEWNESQAGASERSSGGHLQLRLSRHRHWGICCRCGGFITRYSRSSPQAVGIIEDFPMPSSRTPSVPVSRQRRRQWALHDALTACAARSAAPVCRVTSVSALMRGRRRFVLRLRAGRATWNELEGAARAVTHARTLSGRDRDRTANQSSHTSVHLRAVRRGDPQIS